MLCTKQGRPSFPTTRSGLMFTRCHGLALLQWQFIQSCRRKKEATLRKLTRGGMTRSFCFSSRLLYFSQSLPLSTTTPLSLNNNTTNQPISMHKTISLLLVLAMCGIPAQAEITKAGVRVYRINQAPLPSRQVTNQVPLNVPPQRMQKPLPLAPVTTATLATTAPAAVPPLARPIANRPHSRYEAPSTPAPEPAAGPLAAAPQPAPVSEPVSEPAPAQSVQTPPQVVPVKAVPIVPKKRAVRKTTPTTVSKPAPKLTPKPEPKPAPKPEPKPTPTVQKAPAAPQVAPAPEPAPAKTTRRRRLPIAPVN